MWWIWAAALLTIVFVSLLVNSSYGRAFKAIREDETAAQAMGINLFKHKMLSFGISSFLAGIGGALLASLLSTIEPNMFKFSYTYNILLIVVLGGMGSITGSVVSAVVVTCLMEILRFLDEGFLGLPAIPGLRMVVFSVMLMVVILFFPKGIMGNNEFSWNKIFKLFNKSKLEEKEVKV
jgi:branched-chain amino acid transport system permease protein